MKYHSRQNKKQQCHEAFPGYPSFFAPFLPCINVPKFNQVPRRRMHQTGKKGQILHKTQEALRRMPQPQCVVMENQAKERGCVYSHDSSYRNVSLPIRCLLASCCDRAASCRVEMRACRLVGLECLVQLVNMLVQGVSCWRPLIEKTR